MDLDRVVRKIKALGDAEVVNEEGVLLVDSKIKKEKISSLVEVSKVLDVLSPWKPFSYGGLGEAAESIPKKKYKILVKLTGALDVGAKSIYKRINSVRKDYVEEGYENVVYVEVVKKGGRVHFRVSCCAADVWDRKIEVFEYHFLVALENPTLVSEVADFLRVCWVFKVPLILIGEVDKSLIDKARQDTKNVPADFKVLISKSLPKGGKYIGFSKHALKAEKELISEFKKNKTILGKAPMENVILVFGNEKFGLSQDLREKCELFRLGSEVSKPLRGSHALSFVLGLYRSR